MCGERIHPDVEEVIQQVPIEVDQSRACEILCGQILRLMGDSWQCVQCGQHLREIGDEMDLMYSLAKLIANYKASDVHNPST